MSDAAIALASHYGWPLIGLIGVALLAAACWQCTKLRRHNSRLLTTLNNMPQGLCVWSPTARLILCNERYVKMYNLSPDLARPGISLREVIDHRIKAGSFAGNRDQYIADLLSRIAKGKTLTSVREHDGRHISIANRPTTDPLCGLPSSRHLLCHQECLPPGPVSQ
jgi:methyl-accepting chemotaxis protein